MTSFRKKGSRGAILCLACVLLMLLTVLLAGCSFPWQHDSSANASAQGTSNTPVPKPTTQQLLTALQKNFRTVTAFHVVLQLQHPGTVPADSFQIRHADGDVLMPDKVKAQANVVLNGQAVTINMISIRDVQYITDPITGQWRVIKGVLDLRSLTNPDTGLISLVSKLQHVSNPTDDVVNGVPCWRITGQLDAKVLAFLTGGGVPSGTLLQTSACLGKADSLPYQVQMTGEAAVGDTANTMRSFVISNYNENVSITAPAA